MTKSLLPLMSLMTLLAGCRGGAVDVTASEAWVAATAAGQPVGAAYVTLANRGSHPASLVAVEAPGTAETASLHSTSLADGVMRMRPLNEGLEIPAGGQVKLAPMGDHVMLAGLAHPLVAGQQVRLVLRFDDASEVDVVASVRPAMAMR